MVYGRQDKGREDVLKGDAYFLYGKGKLLRAHRRHDLRDTWQRVLVLWPREKTCLGSQAK